MVSRILTTLLITSLWCGAADYQIANKASANLQILTASMPFDLWTNSVVWLTAESPAVETTNWICFANKCSGNARPPSPSQNPIRGISNGVYAIMFDGVDDYISIPHSTNQWIGTNNFNITVKFTRSVAGDMKLMAKSSSGQREWNLRLRAVGTVAFNTSTNKANAESTSLVSAGVLLTNNALQKITIERISGTSKMYLNDIEVATTGSVADSIGGVGGTAALLFGTMDSAELLNGCIYEARLFIW